MDIYSAAERVMGMSDAVWNRHANPMSVWSRFTCLPLIALAIWSRVWIGWWALPALGLALAWTWFNPRAFPEPRDFGSWPSRVTLGERIWLARKSYSIPAHHVRPIEVIAVLPVLGLIPMLAGLITLNASAAFAGLLATVLPKLWFCDRMVWLHVDVTGIPLGTPLPAPVLTQGASVVASDTV